MYLYLAPRGCERRDPAVLASDYDLGFHLILLAYGLRLTAAYQSGVHYFKLVDIGFIILRRGNGNGVISIDRAVNSDRALCISYLGLKQV